MFGPITPGDDGNFLGKSGRLIRPNPAWINPTNQYYIGSKLAFELYPPVLKSRVKAKRKEEFMKTHKSVSGIICCLNDLFIG